jgi:hypothetical protein
VQDAAPGQVKTRQRWWIAALLVLAVGVAVALTASGRERPPPPEIITHEAEPNDDLGHATRIPIGAEVTGTIAPAGTDGQTDRDLYAVKIPHPMAVSLVVTGVPGLNLALALSQFEPGSIHPGKGHLMLDDGPAGAGERVDGYFVHSGTLYVRIEERPFFNEAPRPARGSPQAEYRLKVVPLGGSALEREPNDTLAQAMVVEPGEVITAFTGAVQPYERAWAEQTFSSTDCFLAHVTPQKNGGDPPVAAIVLPPATGRLAVIDAGELEAWRASDRKQNLPKAMLLQGKVGVLPLSVSTRGRAVRIQPVDPTVEAGQGYRVAFVDGEPQGLAAALTLAHALAAEHHVREAAGMLRQVMRLFPGSPQLADLKALLGSAELASAPAP